MESVLVQIILAYAARGLKREPVGKAERVYTHKADYFLKLAFLLKYGHGALYHVSPFAAHVAVEPVFQPVKIKRIALQPVYRGEVTCVGKLA